MRYPNPKDIVLFSKDVAIGKADALISDKVSVDLYKENEDHLKIIEPPFLINEISFPIPQDIRFKSMLDITLNEMQSDGWIENLLKTKYPRLLGTDYSRSKAVQ